MTSPYSSTPAPGTPGPAPAASGSKILGILAVVFGAVSLIGFIVLPIFFILPAIAAVVLGFLSRKREPGARGLALTGIILGFVGIAVNIASMIIGALLIASMMGSM